MKIHVVDDNSDITNMLKLYFTKKGHECSVSNDGRSALTILQNQKFDAVLLDIAMPEVSGIDIIDDLYATKKIQESNIIFITASSIPPEQEEQLKKKDVRAIFKKPIEPDKIMEYLLQFG